MALSPLTPEDYGEKFNLTAKTITPEGKTITGTPSEKQKAALEIALDIRKFEIQLYWQRTTYFWAFIAAAFVAYCECLKGEGGSHYGLQELFAICGVVFSCAWFVINKGSKFWQTNWESHVDALEDAEQGPLYKVIGENKSESKRWLFGARAYSVSRVNQIVSLFVTFLWFVLLIYSAILGSPAAHCWFTQEIIDVSYLRGALSVAGVVCAVIACVAIVGWGKSTFAKDLTKTTKESSGTQWYQR